MARTITRWRPGKFWATTLTLVANAPSYAYFPVACDRVLIVTPTSGGATIVYKAGNNASDAAPEFPIAGAPAVAAPASEGTGIRVLQQNVACAPLEIVGGASYWYFMANASITLHIEGGQAAFCNE